MLSLKSFEIFWLNVLWGANYFERVTNNDSMSCQSKVVHILWMKLLNIFRYHRTAVDPLSYWHGMDPNITWFNICNKFHNEVSWWDNCHEIGLIISFACLCLYWFIKYLAGICAVRPPRDFNHHDLNCGSRLTSFYENPEWNIIEGEKAIRCDWHSFCTSLSLFLEREIGESTISSWTMIPLVLLITLLPCLASQVVSYFDIFLVWKNMNFSNRM